jgi:cyanuric acid amidohydrolase
VTRRAFVHRVAMRAPDDVSGMEALIASGAIDPSSIVAIFGKTEGNGCVNDFSRGFALRALQDSLRRYRPANSADLVNLVMSGGTEGALSPHMVVFEAREVAETPESGALAVGRARTLPLAFEGLGRLRQVDDVAAGVRAAMTDAGLSSPGEVHFVQIKCPLLTADRIAEVEARGLTTATRDTLKSMALSRAASALGVAVALGEIARDRLGESSIGRDWSLFSSCASASAGIELTDHEIVVLGAADHWAGPLRIEHCVMRDAIDIDPVRGRLAALGFGGPGQLPPSERPRLAALLAKAEASSTGDVRGFRHTMLDDSDVSSTRHARAFVAGALAGLIGHTEIYVSGGAEHQGPDGGGPVAIIATRPPAAEGPSP